MVYEQNQKTIVLLAPGTVSTSATTSARVDTVRDNSKALYATFDIVLPAATATNSSASWTTLTLSEADVTSISSATAVNAFAAGTGFTAAAQNDTTNPQITKLFVDLRARKRYLFLTVQAPASHSTVYASVQLGRNELEPAVDSQRGANVFSVIG